MASSSSSPRSSSPRHSSNRKPSSPRTSPGQPNNVVELLPPGSFVKLVNQPSDLPPFQLIHCKGGRCWVRQQAWGQLVQWEVPHRRLTIAS